MIVCGVALLK